jgi:phospholipase C
VSRTIVAAVVLVPLLVVCASRTGAPGGSDLDTAAQTLQTDLRGLENLEHLIFVVQENRSFDHYFGTYPGADGLDLRRDGVPRACIPDPVLGHCSRPYRSAKQLFKGGPHGHAAAVGDVNGGRMDGFVRVVSAKRQSCAFRRFEPACRPFLGPRLQPDVMSYVTRREIPNYWAYADAFVLQDRMFAPTDSWTLPAHLFLVSGWSASCADRLDPMSCTSNIDLRDPGDQHRYGRPPIYAWTDITYLLSEQGVEWAYYVGRGTCIDPPCDERAGRYGTTAPGKNPLPGFVDVVQGDQLGRIRSHEDFVAAACRRSPAIPSPISSTTNGSGIGRELTPVTTGTRWFCMISPSWVR